MWQSAMLALCGMIGSAGMAYAATAPVKGDVYTLKTCPVSGKPLGDKPIIKVYDGREVRFCCEGCPKKFEANKEKYLSKIDAAVIKQQQDRYPLKTCVVSGEKTGDNPVMYVYNNRLLEFCCKDCVKAFKKDPQKYVSKLDAAVIKAQEDSYAAKTCPVSGEELGKMGDPVKMVVGNRLVELCCPACKKPFAKSPLKYLSKLDKAQGKKSDH